MEPEPGRRRRRLFKTRQVSGTAGHHLLDTLEAIKPDFRRAVVAVVVAVACLAVGDSLGGIRGAGQLRLPVLGVTLGFAVAAIIAVRTTSREVARISRPRIGAAAASAIRLLCSVIGYALALLGVLQLLNINLASLLVGGAVTGVVVGIAAQQSLANFVAGLTLLFARPYLPGQRITVHSGALGGPFQGVITDAGLMYTTILTDNGPTKLPNAGLLAAVIEPSPDHPAPDEPEPPHPLADPPGSPSS
jgi:small-conductance mechanosensitive channel